MNELVDHHTLPVPNTDAAIDFLKSLPAPFPTLSASHLDPHTKQKGKFETRSFPPVNGQPDWAQVRNWIQARPSANLYYALNPLLPGTSDVKKASRTDIESVVAFHADVDARVDETQEQARERIVMALEAYEPQP